MAGDGLRGEVDVLVCTAGGLLKGSSLPRLCQHFISRSLHSLVQQEVPLLVSSSQGRCTLGTSAGNPAVLPPTGDSQPASGELWKLGLFRCVMFCLFNKDEQ